MLINGPFVMSGAVISLLSSLLLLFYLPFLLRVLQRVLVGTLTVGDVTIFFAGGNRLQSSLQKIATMTTKVYEQGHRISALRELLEIEAIPTQTEATFVEDLPSSAPIVIENVSFAYPNTNQLVLHDISLTINTGERVAFVGRNGAGKTTLAKLISGLYMPTSGKIRYGHIPLEAIPQQIWYSKVGYVSQQPNRYEATVKENLAYGDWESWRDRLDEVEAIGRTIGIDQFVQEMSEKYDTFLGKKIWPHNFIGRGVEETRNCAPDHAW